MISYNYDEIVDAARVHYENLKADLENASTRIEHLRISALAQEAENLYFNLLAFQRGLVYTHVATNPSFGPMHE